MDYENILQILALKEINAVAIEVLDDIEYVEEENKFVIDDEKVNRYYEASSEITRLKVIRYNKRKMINYNLVANKMQKDVATLDFIDKFSTNDMITRKRHKFNNEISDMITEIDLSELEKHIDDYDNYTNKADTFLAKFHYFKTGVNNNESMKISDIIETSAYKKYLDNLFETVIRIGTIIANARFNKNSEMYSFDNHNVYKEENKAALHRDGKVFKRLVKQLLILVNEIKITTPILNRMIYLYIYNFKQNKNLDMLLQTQFEYYLKNRMQRPLLPTNYFSYFFGWLINTDVKENSINPYTCVKNYYDYMAFIFAKNKIKNEIEKTRIGLEIDILENNEIYNYVHAIFYLRNNT